MTEPVQWIVNCRLASCTRDWKGGTRDCHIAIRGETIADVVDGNASPKGPVLLDAEHRLVTPGLIDCHTHLIFGGDRASEFRRRLEGESYEAIARSGGGIHSTVAATRAASFEDLLAGSQARLANWRKSGFTTVEIKSGYGLDRDSELKMLQVATALRTTDLSVERTLLAAHTLPKNWAGDADDYIDWIVHELMPEIRDKRLAEAVDVFCESIAFSARQSERLLQAALQAGFKIKIHAEQLSNQGGAAMAARLGAISADHLEHLTESDAAILAKHGTVATLLPAAFYSLRETKCPPIQALRTLGVPIALGSDANPGSAPVQQPLLVLNMACTLWRLTPAEALLGMTRHGALALGLTDRGEVRPGLRADLAIWDLDKPESLSYWIGAMPACTRIVGGVRVASNGDATP